MTMHLTASISVSCRSATNDYYKPTIIEKRPAERKAACVERVVCPEDNEEGGIG